MKHLKNLIDWLAESRVQRLIALGLAEPDDFFRIEYTLSTGYLTRSWERFHNGYHTLPAYYGNPAQDKPAFPPAKWWPVPKGYSSEVFADSSSDLSWPDGLNTETLRLQALSQNLVEFLDWIDDMVMDHIVQTRRTPADWTQGTIVVRSVRTGKMEEIDEAKGLNESKDEDIMKLFKLGLIDSPAYLAYEINEERLANLQSEFLDPRASEPAFRKHLIYNALAESFAWWEHRLPEGASKADPNLRLSSVIDGEYWLAEGSIQLRFLMRDGDELDFDVPFEEFLQEIKSRIVKYLSGERAPLDPNYKPIYVLDKETGIRYSVKTG